MIVRELSAIVGTDSDVEAPTWTSRRLLLAGDGQQFSLHDTVLYAGTVTDMWYQHHVEAVYCIEGTGTLVNRETGEEHPLAPGTLYVLDRHDRHTVRVDDGADLRTVCVFTPPITGREVHDENGTYPLLTADSAGTATATEEAS